MAEWVDYPRAHAGNVRSVTDRLKVLRRVHSAQLDNHRDLLVYLPPSYDTSERHYPVVYMHDGQNLFDRATSFAEEWAIDRVMGEASRDGLEAIIVGIPNVAEARCDEYSPFIDRKLGGGRGDRYLDFLIDTVKPLVDGAFRASRERDATGILGSSMGGLISLYAFFRHPEVFGFAGAMSPAIWFADRALFPYLTLAPFVPGRIYLDCGTLEGSAELVDVTRLRQLLVSKGYGRGRDLRCVIEKGGRHNEQAWGRRFRRALEFLVAPVGSTAP